jgi:hypothetical protein
MTNTAPQGAKNDLERQQVIESTSTPGQKGAVVLNPDGSNVNAGVSGYPGAVVDGSSTITLGGTSQQVFPANASRKYLLIQNQSSGSLYINFTSNAATTGNSVLIAANGGYVEYSGNFIPTEKITIIGATTSQAFLAKQG